MFTGIIESIGSIRALTPKGGDVRVHVETGKLDLSDVKLGDSIAVNGVCLTAVELPGNGFAAGIGGSRSTETDVTITRSLAGPDVSISGGKPLDAQMRLELARLAETHGIARLTWDNEVIALRTAPMQRFGKALVAPPPGALEVSAAIGADPERVCVFHSLSKRSNLPGLRSGFVAGGVDSIARIRKLRSFAGAPLPLPVQRVSERAWSDEAHVVQNLALYQEKFRIADAVFAGVQGFQTPEGGFFLWLPVEDGEEAALKLWTVAGVRVLPGAYLSREVAGQNPGKGYIRVALVAPKQEMQRGLETLRDCLYGRG